MHSAAAFSSDAPVTSTNGVSRPQSRRICSHSKSSLTESFQEEITASKVPAPRAFLNSDWFPAMVGTTSKPASFNSRRILAAFEESASSRRTRKTRADAAEAALFVSTVIEPMAILGRTLHYSLRESVCLRVSVNSSRQRRKSRTKPRRVTAFSETFSSGERHVGGTIVRTEVQNSYGSVLLTEGNSVF